MWKTAVHRRGRTSVVVKIRVESPCVVLRGKGAGCILGGVLWDRNESVSNSMPCMNVTKLMMILLDSVILFLVGLSVNAAMPLHDVANANFAAALFPPI